MAMVINRKSKYLDTL